ncbi:phosphoribosylformylglycinamidine synthase [Alkaliphilus hydrothermalis]|uniref:Phosphoribosylformylglycinamidine synthase n=1 Tax=Alkaliphilus hydrothermalis TaxID=1482730 RepID=A0ABS2NTB1_9FIRM|nr:phosphoribosylformylglycinamidine synthase [Alkaliphilus hydrothermalis]MBM7616007.1 phosphoribosylformylglycinamidine synthase [Alkaliphilus hydrothermalis]
MSSVKRLFVEKMEGFTVEADHLMREFKENLNIDGIIDLRVINCYDVEGLTEEVYGLAIENVFSEPNIDLVYEDAKEFENSDFTFRFGLLPGQFDQRADSAEQCIQLLTQEDRPSIRASKIVAISGDLTDEEKETIKNYMINPVESMELGFGMERSLKLEALEPADVEIFHGFIEYSKDELLSFKADKGFAMSDSDIEFIQQYFKNEEKRNPSITELKAIDTYWSDHCRHTTFMTELTDVEIEEGKYNEAVKSAYQQYLEDRAFVHGEKDKKVCLMDLATIAMKKLKRLGKLQDLDESEEINACSIKVTVDVDGRDEEYLVMFKNETHNHPTEIEPFGGAATCLGGAIRDPLSGRSYVYQAMRVTGAADPRTPFNETLAGKLPQKTITTRAAHGYSSYGNQIGVTTGQVKEYYNEKFLAKRMEVGAVIAASPKKEVVREVPQPGDIVILVGGKTGRDGCGGATGSSKEHTEDSLASCGAEVQKGNAPEERKLQRLFRHPELSKIIKRCNDFGAGGVSVAIGELADSIDIYLDRVPKKYEGLDGTEIAISESQERMAVVIQKENLDTFKKYAELENLEATVVADITDTGRLRMQWRGNWIFNISRAFLDTNGTSSSTKVSVEAPAAEENYFSRNLENKDIKSIWQETLSDLNVASQKGMVEMFDSTIGSASVLMPFGGKTYNTPSEGMVAKIPVKDGETNTGTIMTHGYSPDLAVWSPFYGALYAVVESVAKVVAMGGEYNRTRLTFQEYFERLGDDVKKWGKPFAALLGAGLAQNEFQIAAIGGKDSMSGSFKDIHVPPTLISFAVAPVDVRTVVTPELKKVDSKLIMFKAERDNQEVPDFENLRTGYTAINQLINEGKVLASHTVGKGGLVATLSKMAFGNEIGIEIDANITRERLMEEAYGSIVLEVASDFDLVDTGFKYRLLGKTIEEKVIKVEGVEICLDEAVKVWESTLNTVFPIKQSIEGEIKPYEYKNGTTRKAKMTIEKPKVVIPSFPGTNCEDDTARAFRKAGAEVEVIVFRNLNSTWIEESIDKLAKAISTAQIIALPGGFSAGDEPDGSGKFIASVFKNPRIKDVVHELLRERDGLMIGICNGFQALVKLGLLPYGEIRPLDEESPTLTYNKIGRHVAKYAKTKVVSNLSPWLSKVNVGDTFEIPLSHGEGRFFAKDAVLEELLEKGQVATQYVDEEGKATYDGLYNPNGSIYAIEGITSADGRIFGKMGHSERVGSNVAKNIYGEKDMKIFEAGVAYFTGK